MDAPEAAQRAEVLHVPGDKDVRLGFHGALQYAVVGVLPPDFGDLCGRMRNPGMQADFFDQQVGRDFRDPGFSDEIATQFIQEERGSEKAEFPFLDQILNPSHFTLEGQRG